MRHAIDYDAVCRYIKTSDLLRKPDELEGVAIERARGIRMSLDEDPAHREPLILARDSDRTVES